MSPALTLVLCGNLPESSQGRAFIIKSVLPQTYFYSISIISNSLLLLTYHFVYFKDPLNCNMQVETIQGASLRARYKKVRASSEHICKPLGKEDYVVQPVVDVSPPKWHLAHVTWFFETFLLMPFKADYKIYDDDYSYVFNSYYETVGKRVLRADRGNLTRPTVEDVYTYRQYVDQAMEDLLADDFEPTPRFLEVFELGLQHEQQHQELLVTDIKYILGHNPLFPNYFKTNRPDTANSPADPANFLPVSEGLYTIGHQQPGFCFDNELGVHQVYLHGFGIMDRLVTNGEYLEFMKAGGYKDFKYWLMEGWEWVKAEKIQAPMYWYEVSGEWHSYTLRGLQPLDWQAPVTHISYYEAEAFARWSGKRLPTEFEWEAACTTYVKEIPPMAQFQEEGRYLPTGTDPHGYQFYGDAWEWTSSAYASYPYFKTQPGALGEYNGKFMINQMVLRGGSCATPRDHIRPTYRNFFHPHLRWQFTGIRLAESHE